MDSDNLKGLGLALTGALVIVPDTVFMRLSGLSAGQMVAWRGLLLAAAMLAAWLIVSRDRRADLARVATPTGIAAVLAQSVNASLFAWGIGHASVAVVLVALATVPILAALMGAVLLGDRMRRGTIVAAAAVLCGIALSVSGGGHGGAPGSALLGAACGLTVATALAASFTAYRSRPDLPVMPTVGFGALIAGVAGFWLVGSMTRTEGWLPAIWVTGLLILPVSFTLLNVAARYTVAANVSLMLLLETVLAPLAVWLAIGEAVGPRGLAGGALVVGTLAIYLWTERRRSLTPGRGSYSAPEPR